MVNRMVKDYYEILGIARNAGVDEIKRAYKSLAKKYHPDINKEKGAEEKFKEVQHAYSVLGDEQKRRNYNQFGAEAEKFQGFEGFGGGFRAADFPAVGTFKNYFYCLFGILAERQNRTAAQFFWRVFLSGPRYRSDLPIFLPAWTWSLPFQEQRSMHRE